MACVGLHRQREGIRIRDGISLGCEAGHGAPVLGDGLRRFRVLRHDTVHPDRGHSPLGRARAKASAPAIASGGFSRAASGRLRDGARQRIAFAFWRESLLRWADVHGCVCAEENRNRLSTARIELGRCARGAGWIELCPRARRLTSSSSSRPSSLYTAIRRTMNNHGRAAFG